MPSGLLVRISVARSTKLTKSKRTTKETLSVELDQWLPNFLVRRPLKTFQCSSKHKLLIFIGIGRQLELIFRTTIGPRSRIREPLNQTMLCNFYITTDKVSCNELPRYSLKFFRTDFDSDGASSFVQKYCNLY